VYCPSFFAISIISPLYFHKILSFKSTFSGLYKKEKDMCLTCLICLELFKEIIFLLVSKYKSDLDSACDQASITLDFSAFHMSDVERYIFSDKANIKLNAITQNVFNFFCFLYLDIMSSIVKFKV
jgi:hypothetical protein